MTDYIATPKRTRAILRRYHLNAKKQFGQNFVMNPEILLEMVAAAGVTKATDVIEVGPGIGALTEILCQQARRVLAYEIDARMLPVLEQELSAYDNLTVKQADFLTADLGRDLEVVMPKRQELALVSNLPYYITTPILSYVVEQVQDVTTLAVMMQWEVAERLTAKPGTKAYGALTVRTQYDCTAEIVRKVPPSVFQPRPNVDSAIVLLRRRPAPAVTVADETQFFALVTASFAHRRKTLWNNLRAAYPGEREELRPAFDATGIDPRRRAETLSLSEFAALSDALRARNIRL